MRREPDDFDALAGAEVVVRGRFENQRLAVVPMEGAAIAVVPGDDGDGHELTVYLACQMPHSNRNAVANGFGVEPEKVRLIAPHVGGSFGAKHWIPEGIVAVRIARELGRPVKWIETRSENMVAMPHGRGQVQYLELGLRRDGTIVGLRCRVVGDAGAYGGFGGMLAFGPTRMMAQGVYRIPKIGYDCAVALTNLAPMGAYRGAGRPEAAAMLERILDMAADELEIDPVEIRRRNFLRPDEFPYSTVTGVTYDVGDYDAALTEALRVAGYEELRAEQAARRERGDVKQLGIGICAYVEITAGGTSSEYAEVEVHADGSAHGEGGHLGPRSGPRDGVRADRHRSARHPDGAHRVRAVRHRARPARRWHRRFAVAADRWQRGARSRAGCARPGAQPRRRAARGRAGRHRAQRRRHARRRRGPGARDLVGRGRDQASDDGLPLAVEHDFVQSGASFPFGAHVSVVEVDTETGRVEPIRHIAVDDCGRILNPMLVDGQVHGGLASGISQALWEEMVYDDDGNPLTSTLAEYAMPSAAEFPPFEVAHTETPSPLNPLGAKGIGESATVGCTPAVQNAVVDALSHLGVRHIDMPCSPERVWRAIEHAKAGTLPDPWREPPAAFATLTVRPRDVRDAHRGRRHRPLTSSQRRFG